MVERIPLTKKMKDITGYRRGRLVAVYPIKDAKTRVSTAAIWLCHCDCGNQAVVVSNSLLRGTTFSCGCQKSEKMKVNRKSVTHDMSYTPEWRIWSAMKRRCVNKNCKEYSRYGGRGIAVCDRWLKFENFYEDMGNRPSPHLTIERIDNDGNYEPGNCRWATQKEQGRNKRNNVIVTAFGQTDRLLNFISSSGVKSRIYRRAAERINCGADPEITIVAALLGR